MPCVRLCVRVVSVCMQRKQRQKQKGIEVFFWLRAGKRPAAVTTGAQRDMAGRYGRLAMRAARQRPERERQVARGTCSKLASCHGPTSVDRNARGTRLAAGNAPIVECPASRGPMHRAQPERVTGCVYGTPRRAGRGSGRGIGWCRYVA